MTPDGSVYVHAATELLLLRTYMIEAHEIVPGLWQGSQPYTGSRLADAGFGALVLCAVEYQPPRGAFPGLQVLHAPNEDDPLFPMSKADLETAVWAATRVQGFLAEGKKVLVTCVAGINRSGLVVALALHKTFGYSGESCIDIVRDRRLLRDGVALRNPQFVDALLKLPGKDVTPDAIRLPGIRPILLP